MDDNNGASLMKVFLQWGVFPNPQDVITNVQAMRDRNPRIKDEDIINNVIVSARRVATAQGVVASLPGAIPGLGTAAQAAVMVGSATPETILLFRKMAHIQLSIAHICGHEIYDSSDRRRIHVDRIEELFVILGIMTGAIIPAKEAAKKLGSKFVTVQISKNLSGRVLRDINKRVGFTLLTKFGVKRGGIALGRIIPLGIGASIGGAMNYASINQFAGSARKFYAGSDDAYAMPD
jgi:hypothetical protein